MALIVVVHGIGQQYKGDAVLHDELWPALKSGLSLAGTNLDDRKALVCPFYGHLFRGADRLGAADRLRPSDLTKEEQDLLSLFWTEATALDPDISPPSQSMADPESLARTPQLVQKALNALSRSRFWANVAQSMMLGDLRQVIAYMNDPAVASQILELVQHAIGEDTRVVIGHSLGSIIAYEALCAAPHNVVSFLTLGSPLGIRNLIFDRLTPRPGADGKGAWPRTVRHWTNIAERGDVVALVKRLSPLFGDPLRDVLVHNGSEAHSGHRYLTTIEAGRAVQAGL